MMNNQDKTNDDRIKALQQPLEKLTPLMPIILELELNEQVKNSIEEIWVDIIGFSHYEVSNTGLVRRKLIETIYKDGRIAHFSQTILKPGLNKKGYKRVFLSQKSKKVTKSVHRLVAESFIPNPNNLPQVNHIDCNKLNNNISNLEWISNIENMRHAFRNGIYKERDKTTILNIKHMKNKLIK